MGEAWNLPGCGQKEQVAVGTSPVFRIPVRCQARGSPFICPKSPGGQQPGHGRASNQTQSAGSTANSLCPFQAPSLGLLGQAEGCGISEHSEQGSLGAGRL